MDCEVRFIMWWNCVECPPRQSHKTFIHFNEDDTLLLQTESLFCIVDRFVIRYSVRQTYDVCGKQMAATMRCHHAHGCCHFDFIVYFVLTSFYCYLWSRIIHPNSQREVVKFHHFADDFIATFTVLGVAYCLDADVCSASTAITRNFINVWWTR